MVGTWGDQDITQKGLSDDDDVDEMDQSLHGGGRGPHVPPGLAVSDGVVITRQEGG